MKAMRFADAGAVRALMEGDKHILEVLAIPYGGPGRKDRLGQYFSTRTDLWLAEGDRRPVLYMHGFSPQMRKMDLPPVLGTAEVVRRDDEGVWMRAEIDQSELSMRTWKAAQAGNARASTGSIAHLERHDEVTGEVLMWPVVELSVFDGGEKRVPVSDDAVVLPIRAIYDDQGLKLPEAFEERAVEDEEPDEEPEEEEGERAIMTEEIKEAPAVEPTPVVPKEEPAKRAIFNVRKETVGEPADNAEKESWEWYWHMRHGITKGPSMRVLEEHDAAEGLPLVPQVAYDGIVAMRDQSSVASRAGLKRIEYNGGNIFNIPRESTAMTALALIAEEGAYVANEPAFALLAITVLKYGSMITATEELLEDQNLFIPWFNQACGRAWGIAENAQLYTTMDVAGNGTIGVTGSDTLTLAEFNTFFYFMTTPYRDGAKLIMNPGTMAVLEGLLVATPYALGAYPDTPRTPMGLPVIRGCEVHLCSDWLLYSAAAANGLTLSMVNPEFAGIVQRRGMTIKVDPYGDSLNGRIRYFPSVRFAPFVSQPLAHVIKNGI